MYGGRNEDSDESSWPRAAVKAGNAPAKSSEELAMMGPGEKGPAVRRRMLEGASGEKTAPPAVRSTGTGRWVGSAGTCGTAGSHFLAGGAWRLARQKLAPGRRLNFLAPTVMQTATGGTFSL